MTLTVHLTCPHCEEDVIATGEVTGPERYSIGEYGPPGAVFEDGPECDLMTPPCCPHCGSDLYHTAIGALIARAEDVCRRR